MPISEPRARERRRQADIAAPTSFLASRHDALLGIIARAAAPHERSSLPCFAPSNHTGADRIATIREQEWMQALTGGDAEAFHNVLTARGLSLAHARRGLADVAVADATALPQWARDVLMLFRDDMPRTTGHHARNRVPTFQLGELSDLGAIRMLELDPAAPWSLHRIFEPLVARGEEHLREVVERSGVTISAAAQRALLAALAQRLSGPCTTLLFHKLTETETLLDHPGIVGQTVEAAFFGDQVAALESWVSLFGCYPVVARILAVAFRNWYDASVELIARLDRDYERLGSTLAATHGGGLGALVDCSMGAGDPHDHGRTVAVLTFESGTKVVYKPKDLRIATAYMRLVETLNAAGLTPPLATRRIIEGDGYGWEEFVGDRHCTFRAEVQRFYRQMGFHVRLVQLLDGIDFTADNVIADGDSPALIDLETLLVPRVPVMGRPEAGTTTGMALALDSPVRSCLVTAKILGDRGRPAAELGALAPEETCIAPFKQRVLRLSSSGPTLVDVYPEFPDFRAAPSLNGVRVSSTEYFDDVIAGYVAMGEHLRQLQPVLAAADGPLAMFRDVRVRCLCRDTHIYARMLQSSLTPARLRDGVERELCLERMWKARFSSPAMVAAEVDSLRDLDIPMFASCPGATPLLSEGAVLVESFFSGTAFERLNERVRALPLTTQEHDRALIESALFTLAPEQRRRLTAATKRRSASRPEWLAVAERIGTEIEAAAIATTTEPKWIGGHYHPRSGCWVFSVLGDDLYSGASGIGLVMAELASATGSRRLAQTARMALRGVAERLTRVYAQMSAEPLAHPPGALFGWAGQLYACDRGSVLLGEPELGEPAAALLRTLAQAGHDRLSDLLARSRASDVATGTAGLLLVVLATEAGTDAERDSVARAAGEQLLRHASIHDTELLYPPNAFPRGVIGAQVSRRLGLARWSARSGDAAAALGALDDDSEKAVTAADLLGLLSVVSHEAPLDAALLRSVDAQLARPVRDSDGLGWLERGEVALAAHTVAKDTKYFDVALDAGERLFALKEQTGRWLPECLLADQHNLSAVVGLGAIAHFFLQLASPGRLRSYRTLE